jgi:FlaA1/EpsC-like NDP-sugar epimerase
MQRSLGVGKLWGRGTGKVARLSHWLLGRHRLLKRAVLVFIDLTILSSVLWSLLCIRHATLYVPTDPIEIVLLIMGPLITVGVFAWFGFYKMVTRFMGARSTSSILLYVALSVLVWTLAVFMVGQNNVPRSVILAFGIFGGFVIWVSRQAAAGFLKTAGIRVPTIPGQQAKVIIYGAGAAGQQLCKALLNSDRKVVGFIDSVPNLWGQYIDAIKVYRPEKIDSFVKLGVKEILVALPSQDRQLRRRVLRLLDAKGAVVKIMPAIEDIAAGRVSVTDFQPIDVVELLGREPISPIADLMSRNITGKSVLLTGAGGSVGSELVRQILRHKPRRLVLLDVSEAALYQIATEVHRTIAAFASGDKRSEVFAVLGSVCDPTLIAETLARHSIQTIYHAAAYKHVPIVEDNPFVGLHNNVFGTSVVAEAALAHGVELMVLISTDKAVRPANVMGASKRLSELVLQALAAQDGPTIFTIVRFGNVLDSSGSVIRRFRQQIDGGGPITVTDPKVSRYFMSIPEAAELVIQAGSMARTGQVSLLDMGEPIKILDLARLMLRLSGRDERHPGNPDGDIEIVFTGLGPGEKLFEELLINARQLTSATAHPRIFQSDEPFLEPQELGRELETLGTAIATRNQALLQAVLLRTVDGYAPGPEDARPAGLNGCDHGRTAGASADHRNGPLKSAEKGGRRHAA